VNGRPHWTSAAVLVLALGGSLAAAGAVRRVRDTNEERLLEQRAESVAQIVSGLGGTFEADLVAAAVVADRGSVEELEAQVASAGADFSSGTWALVDRRGGSFAAAHVIPPDAPTYFDGLPIPAIDRQLEAAFAGEFVVTGIFGEGIGRRMGIAAGIPGTSTDRVVYLEFPLVAVAASSAGDAEDPSLFEDIDVALYVGRQPTDDGLIFSTFEGELPGDIVTSRIAAGGMDVLVATAAKRPLSGALASALPNIVFVFGASIGALAALLVEVSRRKQRAALRLADELRGKHADLEVALAEQQRAETNLREAQRREVVGQLAGGIAHDFNNLLAVITGYAELVGDRVTDPGARADLAEITSAAARGAALVRQLLVFAREESADTDTSNVNTVVRDLSKLLERTVGADVALVIDAEADPATVQVTTSELEQIVVNLVVNARHAIDSGGLISVRTRSDAEAGTVVLEVADDGVGMTVDVAARAFEPLFTTRARDEGSGLGLTTVANIARRAGGVASIDSAPGKGTTVRVVLPVAEGAGAPASEDATAPVSVPERLTVLLVEDEEPVRRATRRMLEAHGYRVHEASSGQDAVARFIDTCVPDVIVTDVVMPGGLAGRDVAARFRTRIPNLPVVFVTGHAGGLSDADLTAGTGTTMIVTKPFSSAVLQEAVAGALGDKTAKTGAAEV
jgi:signal transduction histidine kinase/CheY-like chemotaxis protein